MSEVLTQATQEKQSEKPQVQTTQSKSISWKKIIVTVVVITVVLAIVVGLLWWFVFKETDTTTTQPAKVSTPSAKQATPSATATPSAEKDETADWKTFESKIHNYSLSYPQDWTFKRDTSEISTDILVESVYLNTKASESPNVPNIKIIGGYDYNKLCKNKQECEKESVGFENVELAGKLATKWTNTGLADEVYYVKPSSYYYLVVFVNYGEDKELTNKVLSTFKFLPSQ